MKKIFAITILALAFVTSAFAQKVFPDPNGNTSFTQLEQKKGTIVNSIFKKGNGNGTLQKKDSH